MKKWQKLTKKNNFKNLTTNIINAHGKIEMNEICSSDSKMYL